jgi:hypothetical protein
MSDHNPLERAVLAAALFGGPPRTYEVGQADIRLAEGSGHLLTNATITGWELPDDVMTGRCE